MVFFAHDNANRVSAIKWHDGAAPLAYFEYARGNGGLITSLYHATADLTAVYEYDGPCSWTT